MARVTVEDCIQVVDNRFELILLAAQRARDISAGQELRVERENDKNPVVSLREIAEGRLNLEQLKSHIVSGVNRHDEMTSEDDELAALQRAEEAIGGVDEAALLEGNQMEELTFDADANAAATLDDEDFEDLIGTEVDLTADADADADAEGSESLL